MNIYEISRFGIKIKKLEVTRETEKSYFIGKQRLAKTHRYFTYFDTYEEAKTALLDRLRSRVAYYEDAISLHREAIAELEAQEGLE